MGAKMAGNIPDDDKDWLELLIYLKSDEFHSTTQHAAARKLVKHCSSDEVGFLSFSPAPSESYRDETILNVTADTIFSSVATVVESKPTDLDEQTKHELSEFLKEFDHYESDIVSAVLQAAAKDEALEKLAINAGRGTSPDSASTTSSSGSGTTSKYHGIRKESPDAPWRARIRSKGREYYLIETNDPTEAAVAYVIAKKNLDPIARTTTRQLRESDIYLNLDKYLARYPDLYAKIDAEIKKIESVNRRMKN